ncbi:MAG TPA: DUF3300 domain-containing protein [Bryobacteraceae bacterium]|nr:DUF3300 domain-containing protein [Bryobacteraceae bacterium]
MPPTDPAQTLTGQQLDDLVAPIALYPDPLLGQVLAASTYPVELVEAQQWLKTVGNLSGQALMDAAKQQDWDPSVQALVAMPDVMNLLTQDIRWTTDLGNAFLAQQADVMGAVQRMRQRAQANGQLKSNEQETVSTNYDNGQAAIEIVPTNPEVIYVPAYDPYYVWGYSAYPPLYYPDGYWFGPGINIGFYFGGWGGWTYGGWGWGWRPNWFAHNIYINHGFFDRYHYRYGGFGGGRHNVWVHDPGHRWGAGYPRSVASRFGGAARAARINEGRSGNWHTFGGGGNGFRGTGNGFNGSRFNGSNGSRFNGSNGSRVNGSEGNRGGGPNGFQGGGSNGFRGGNNNNGGSFRGSGMPQQRIGAGAQNLRGQSIRSQIPQRNLQSTPERNFRPAPQRNFRSTPQSGGFQSSPRMAAPRMSAPQRSFQSAPRMAAPRMSAPQRSFQSAPRMAAPRMSAPQRSFQSAPRMSAPRMSAPAASRSMGGGGARSFGGGGGGSHGGGGGGGFRGGGGGHGRR